MHEETILDFLRLNDNTVATTDLAIALDVIDDRSDLYNMLVSMTWKGLVKRSCGVESNGHTMSFNWTTP